MPPTFQLFVWRPGEWIDIWNHFNICGEFVVSQSGAVIGHFYEIRPVAGRWCEHRTSINTAALIRIALCLSSQYSQIRSIVFSNGIMALSDPRVGVSDSLRSHACMRLDPFYTAPLGRCPNRSAPRGGELNPPLIKKRVALYSWFVQSDRILRRNMFR